MVIISGLIMGVKISIYSHYDSWWPGMREGETVPMGFLRRRPLYFLWQECRHYGSVNPRRVKRKSAEHSFQESTFKNREASIDMATEQNRNTGPTEINRGDIFWVEPDELRGSVPGYPHPHVVVQDDVFNRSRIDTVVVCALTSNPNRANEPGNVLLEPGEGNLQKQSVVVVSQVSSIPKRQLGAYIGALSQARVDQILAGMRFQQLSFFNRR